MGLRHISVFMLPYRCFSLLDCRTQQRLALLRGHRVNHALFITLGCAQVVPRVVEKNVQTQQQSPLRGAAV
eukprot:4759940-Pleurochrysis_carterae.AAC.3